MKNSEKQILFREVQKGINQSFISFILMLILASNLIIAIGLDKKMDLSPIYVNGSIGLFVVGLIGINLWLTMCKKQNQKVFDNLENLEREEKERNQEPQIC